MNKYIATDKGNDYSITLQEENGLLKIVVIEINSKPKIIYSTSYSLEDLVKKNKFFKLFDSVTDILPDLDIFMKNHKYALSLEHGGVKLSLYLPLKIVEEIVFIVPQIESNEKTFNLEVVECLNNLNKQVQQMNSKILFLSEIIEPLKDDPQILSRIATIKANQALNSDLLILDDYEMNFLKNCIPQETNKIMKMTLLYKLTKDSDQSSVFHKLCDNKGPTLTIVKTTKGYRGGGFTSISWDSSGAYKNDTKAFVFSLDRKKMYKAPSNGSNAIYCNNSYGPTFGAGHDLYVANGCNSNTNSYCNFPYSYTGGLQYELTGLEKGFTVKDVEVYLITYE